MTDAYDWDIKRCRAYAEQLRDKTRANTAEHAAQAIEWLLAQLASHQIIGKNRVTQGEEHMTDEDDEFARIEREQAMGWRKRQVEDKKELDPYRNMVLEEVALQFDMMPALGDTAASFAAFVRGMKR